MTLTREQQALVADNLGLIAFTMTKRCGIHPTHSLYEDLWQEGVLGLIRAAELYDPTKARFSTYAVIWIRQAVQRGQEHVEGKNFAAATRAGRRYERPAPLDATVDGHMDRTLADLLPDPFNVEDETIALLIDDVRACAHDDLDRAVIDAAFELPAETGSFRDKAVGKVFGVSPESVRRRKRAMAARYREQVVA